MSEQPTQPRAHTFTRRELETSELLLVVQPDGRYKWSSHRSPQQVADHLIKLAFDIMQKAEASDG